MATSKRTAFNRFLFNRVLSLILVTTMLLSLVPVPAKAASSATLPNGQPVTEDNVLFLMNEYKNGKSPGTRAQAAGFTSYTDNATYDPYNPRYYLSPFGGGTECAKFAFAFWDDIFGDLPMREITSPEDVQPGDLLHFEGHWAIAMKKAYNDRYGNICTSC